MRQTATYAAALSCSPCAPIRYAGHRRRHDGHRHVGCRTIDPNEGNDGGREELARGVQGVLRWKGLDESGRFCAVIETTGGVAYHLPVSGRVATDARLGQIVQLRRAFDKEQQIEEAAQKSGWTYDPSALPEGSRAAYRNRLEQLERLGLAAREPAAFGREVREALEKRYEHLRELGLEPGDEKLRFCDSSSGNASASSRIWPRAAGRARRAPPSGRASASPSRGVVRSQRMQPLALNLCRLF
jgi:hypothetical protein